MDYQTLIHNVHHDKPEIRLETIYMIGMVDEERAFDALGRRYIREEDPKVKEALVKVSRYLISLRDNDFDTLRTISQYFNVYKEVLYAAQPEELQRIAQYARKFSNTPPPKDFSLHAVMVVDLLRTHLASGKRPDFSTRAWRRAPAPKLTSDEFGYLVKEYRQIQDEDRREKLVIQICNLMNPAALPLISRIHHTEKSLRLRRTAKQAGRQLYWRVQYVAMLNDGTVERIQKEACQQLGIVYHEITEDIDPLKPADEEVISDILSQAEEYRRKRNKRI